VCRLSGMSGDKVLPELKLEPGNQSTRVKIVTVIAFVTSVTFS